MAPGGNFQSAVVVQVAGHLPKEKGKLPIPGQGGIIRNAPIPTFAKPPLSSQKARGLVIVRVRAVALNPTDYKHLDFISDVGCLLGCDFAGEIAEVGSTSKREFKVGDRVAGFVHGGNNRHKEIGAFAEVIVAKEDLLIRLPNDWTFEQGASLGTGVTTVGQSLYQSLQLPRPLSVPSSKHDNKSTPPQQQPWLLIYGGSTATGLLAIQFAKLSGYTVVATASKHNFDICKEYGADHVFDYHDGPACSRAIRQTSNSQLRLALDCIADAGTAKICADAMARSSSLPSSSDPASQQQDLIYTSLLPLPDDAFPRKDVKVQYTLAYSVGGEPFSLGRDQQFEARPEDAAFATDWIAELEQLLVQHRFRTVPLSLEDGGLDAVLDGLDELRSGNVSGEKLIYSFS